jgi:hypothetical protein
MGVYMHILMHIHTYVNINYISTEFLTSWYQYTRITKHKLLECSHSQYLRIYESSGKVTQYFWFNRYKKPSSNVYNRQGVIIVWRKKIRERKKVWGGTYSANRLTSTLPWTFFPRNHASYLEISSRSRTSDTFYYVLAQMRTKRR